MRVTPAWTRQFADSSFGDLHARSAGGAVLVCGASLPAMPSRHGAFEVMSFDAHTGEERWRALAKPRGSRSLFALFDDAVVVRTAADRSDRVSLDALELESGMTRWSTEYPSHEDMQLLGVDPTTAWTKSAFSINARAIDTGADRWAFTGARINSAALCGDAMLLNVDDMLFALDANTGEQRWMLPSGRASILATNTTRALVAVGPVLLLLDAPDASTTQIASEVDRSWFPFGANTDLALVGPRDFTRAETEQTYVAIDLATGTERFRITGELRPVGISDKTILMNARLETHAFDVRTGERVWSSPRWLEKMSFDRGTVLAGDHVTKQLVAIEETTGAEQAVLPGVPADEFVRDVMTGPGYVVVTSDTSVAVFATSV